jgi:hypothetical protein
MRSGPSPSWKIAAREPTVSNRKLVIAPDEFQGGSPDLAISQAASFYQRRAGPQHPNVTFAVINRHRGQG